MSLYDDLFIRPKKLSDKIFEIIFFIVVIGFFGSILFAASCKADPIRGTDPLGKAKQNCQMMINEADTNSATGELDATFGDPYPCMNREAKSGKFIANRIHLIDGTVSNHACTGNVTNYKLIAERAKRFKKWCNNHGNIKCYLSTILESGCRDSKVVKKQNATARKAAPGIPIVCSSIVGVCADADIKETHGNTGTAQIRSNDGNSVFDSDSAKYRDSGSILTLAWSQCDNGRVSGEHPGDPVPPPKLRTNWCTKEEVRQKVRLMREPEPKPNIPGCVDFKSPETSKTNAEYYGKASDDGRGNKPMTILPQTFQRLSIQKTSGQEIGCFKHYGSYQGGGQRHYEGNCSKLTPSELMDRLGSEWGLLKVKDKCWYWNAIRRLGTFH